MCVASRLTVALAALSISILYADDFLTSGAGARSAATAGAYLPSADNALDAMAVNPAGLASLSAPVLDLSLKAVFARGQFTNPANPDARLNSNGAIPYGVFGMPLGKHLSIGFGALPELLGDASWKYNDAPGNAGDVGYGRLRSKSEIIAVRAAGGIGLFLGPRLQIGATVGAVYNSNTLDTAYVFQNFAPLAGLKTLLNLHTTGIGWNSSFGGIVRASRRLQVGVTYKTRTTVRSTGSANGNAGVQFAALGLGAFRPDFRYKAEVDNILPQTAVVNLVFHVNRRTQVVTQADWINWKNSFVRLPVLLTSGNNADLNNLLGSTSIADSVPLHWRDQYITRIGIERSWLENVVIRAGYAHSNSPVPDSTLTPLTAAITRHTLSAGFGYRHERWNYNVAYVIDPEATQTVQKSLLRAGEFDNSAVHLGTQTLILTFSIR